MRLTLLSRNIPSPLAATTRCRPSSDGKPQRQVRLSLSKAKRLTLLALTHAARTRATYQRMSGSPVPKRLFQSELCGSGSKSVRRRFSCRDKSQRRFVAILLHVASSPAVATSHFRSRQRDYPASPQDAPDLCDKPMRNFSIHRDWSFLAQTNPAVARQRDMSVRDTPGRILSRLLCTSRRSPSGQVVSTHSDESLLVVAQRLYLPVRRLVGADHRDMSISAKPMLRNATSRNQTESSLVGATTRFVRSLFNVTVANLSGSSRNHSRRSDYPRLAGAG